MADSHPNSPLGPGEKMLLADLQKADRRETALVQALKSLIERLTKAEDDLLALHNTTAYPLNASRLRGKAEGVRLARSYAEETLREARRG